MIGNMLLFRIHCFLRLLIVVCTIGFLVSGSTMLPYLQHMHLREILARECPSEAFQLEQKLSYHKTCSHQSLYSFPVCQRHHCEHCAFCSGIKFTQIADNNDEVQQIPFLEINDILPEIVSNSSFIEILSFRARSPPSSDLSKII